MMETEAERQLKKMREAFQGALAQGMETPRTESVYAALRVALEEIQRVNPKAPLRSDGDPMSDGLVVYADGGPLIKVRCKPFSYQVTSILGTRIAWGEDGLIAAIADAVRASARDVAIMSLRRT